MNPRLEAAQKSANLVCWLEREAPNLTAGHSEEAVRKMAAYVYHQKRILKSLLALQELSDELTELGVFLPER